MILVSHHADVTLFSNKAQIKLLLNVVGILILIDYEVANALANRWPCLEVVKEFEKKLLLMRKVDAVCFKEQITIRNVGLADCTDERI